MCCRIQKILEKKMKIKNVKEELAIVKKQLFYSILLIVAFMLSIFAWAYIAKKANLEDDSMIEELIEDLIEKKLDLREGSFDLTPLSKE
jgi:hypothetical protein